MTREHLATMIFTSTSQNKDRTAMKFKKDGTWHAISYDELGDSIRCLAKALLDIGVQEGDMIGIFSDNMPAWHIADYAILSVKGTSVPIYATNTEKQAEYIIKDAGISILFAGNQVQYDKAVSIAKSVPGLKKVIAMDESITITGSISVYISDLIKAGKESKNDDELEKRINSGSPEDLATIIYTSGTTGDPKGAMLTHANFFNQFTSVEHDFNVGPADQSLCFLPLSHVYERTWSNYVFRQGATNNYMANQKEILAYLSEVKPTAMVSVPRLYEKIYAAVHDQVEKTGGLKMKLFNWAVDTGKRYAYAKKDGRFIGPFLMLKHYFADRLVLKKLRDLVGGYKNFFSAGGAALSMEIEEFFFACGLIICQGYGLTETSPMCTCNRPNDFKFGTVGKPIKGCDIRISADGEIQVKGGNVMKGYFNKPDETKEVFTDDGYFKTGDVGVIDEDGFLRITDRIKDLIITSQGKNIAPQHVETVIGVDHYIEQIATIGDKRKFLTALIVPSFEALEQYAKSNNISYSSREELVNNPEIINFMQDRIERNSTELANYEKVKRFTILPHEFSQESGELTPTLKLKRKIIQEKYAEVIDAMYKD